MFPMELVPVADMILLSTGNQAGNLPVLAADSPSQGHLPRPPVLHVHWQVSIPAPGHSHRLTDGRPSLSWSSVRRCAGC